MALQHPLLLLLLWLALPVCIGAASGHEGVRVDKVNVVCTSPDNSTQYIDPLTTPGADGPRPSPNFIAVDAKTGKQKWTFPLDIEQTPNYSAATPGCVTSPDGSVVYASNESWYHDGSVHAIDAGTGKQMWAVHGFGEAILTFKSFNTPSTVYVTSQGPAGGCGGQFAIDGKTGKRGTFDVLPGVECTLMVMSPDKSTMYIADGTSVGPFLTHTSVHAFDAQTAQGKWVFSGGLNYSKFYNLYLNNSESVSPDGRKVTIDATYSASGECCDPKTMTQGKFEVDAISGKQIGSFVPAHGDKRPEPKGVVSDSKAFLV